MKKYFYIILATFFFSLGNASAETIECSIANVSALNKNGYFVSHGWKTNYLNRKFTIDKASGKVLNTTALKERLSNFDATHSPTIISKEDDSSGYIVFTQFEESGTYSLFQMNDFLSDSAEKPYFYLTSIGMILSGTCEIKN